MVDFLFKFLLFTKIVLIEIPKQFESNLVGLIFLLKTTSFKSQIECIIF